MQEGPAGRGDLKRRLGMVDAASVACGAMLSGLFILPGLAYAISGPGLLAAYLLAWLLAATGMLSQAELSSAMPKAGGAYFFVSRSMGPSVGTVYGLITWISLCLKSAVELLAVTIFAGPLIGGSPALVAGIFCLAFLLVNLLGVRQAGVIQTILVGLILAALGLYVFRGLTAIDVQHYAPFAPQGLQGVMAGAGFIFVSFGGLLKIASIAEEVQSPAVSIPRSMILALVVVGCAYLSVIFVTIGVARPEMLRGAFDPVSLAARSFLGPSGGVAFNVVAICALLTAANAGIMAASRYPLALSRDGLLPEVFSRVNVRFHTPHVAILLTGGLVVATLCFTMEVVVKAASSVLILTYVFSCLSIIIMRESHLQNYRPHFHAPFYPWIQLLGLLGFGMLLFQTGIVSLVTMLFIILGGALLHGYYGRTGRNKEFALLHLIERLLEREYTDHVLETELKEIIHERDSIAKDRFDELIEDCLVLDIERSLTKEEFFEAVSGLLAERGRIRQLILKGMFLIREEQSSTVLSPFLSIPHVRVRGQRTFEILVARCRGGIRFSEDFQEVHAVFVLMSTRDMRQMHLHSLAAIAQIFQDPDFETRWMNAKNEKALRDTILLAPRRRQVAPPGGGAPA